MEQFNANPIRSGVGLTVTPPQTASRSITPTESHKPDPQNLIHVFADYVACKWRHSPFATLIVNK